MPKTKVRALSAQEKHELVYALAIARISNNRHQRECLRESAACEDKQVFANLTAEAAKYEMWADLDEDLQELVSLDRIVIVEEDDGE